MSVDIGLALFCGERTSGACVVMDTQNCVRLARRATALSTQFCRASTATFQVTRSASAGTHHHKRTDAMPADRKYVGALRIEAGN